MSNCALRDGALMSVFSDVLLPDDVGKHLGTILAGTAKEP